MSETTENESHELSEVDQRELLVYGEMFYQMLQRPWFSEIVETRFDFHKVINEEEKSIELRVIEVPMEVTMDRISKLRKEQEANDPKIIDTTDAKVQALRNSLA